MSLSRANHSGSWDMFSLSLSRRNVQEYHQVWFIMALAILLGAGCGILFAASAGAQYLSLMRMAVSRPVSIVGSAVAVFLPFLVCFLLIVHSKPWLVCFICAITVGSVSAACWALYELFGSAAWLVRLLMQCPQSFTVAGVVFLSLKKLSGTLRWRYAVYAILILAILGMIDYFAFSPLLVKLIDSYETMEGYVIHAGFDWRL